MNDSAISLLNLGKQILNRKIRLLLNELLFIIDIFITNFRVNKLTKHMRLVCRWSIDSRKLSSVVCQNYCSHYWETLWFIICNWIQP